jgi:hypothetical protein
MKNRILIGAAVVVLPLAVITAAAGLQAQNAPARSAPAPATTTSATVTPDAAAADRALMDKYCVTCHNERAKVGNLSLETLGLGDVASHADVWEKVVAKVRGGAMPPPAAARPDAATLSGFASSVEQALDLSAAQHPNPGRPVAHRLNRAEYTNAIRDLFGLNVDGRTLLPADDSGFGFDNIGDVLSVSSGLMERYLSAARTVARQVVGDPEIRPTVVTYKTPKNERQEERVSEDAPFGTRGGLSFHHFAPVDGDYTFKIRVLRTVGDQDYIRGLHRLSAVDVRLDGARTMQFTIGGQPGCPVQGLVGRDCFKLLSGPTPQITTDEPDALLVKMPLSAGDHVFTVAFADQTLELEGLKPRYPTGHYTFQNEIEGLPFIDSVDVDGPYQAKVPVATSPTRKAVFVCQPGAAATEASCAKTIVRRIVRRAYRRPVTDADLDPILQFYRDGHAAAGSFDAGIESAIVRVLVSPQFLFRTEREPAAAGAGQPYKISDVELASRLSFFLWSSIPDDQLLDLAEHNKLSDPAVLAAQVTRMLGDPRSESLTANFAGQWLMLRNLQSIMPDTHEFPDFDDELRAAERRETELFFDSQIRENHGVPELLSADYTFLNQRLAEHYGLPNVYGSHFRRVAVTDERRRGLLGQASILTVTSYPNRTSPVLRGKWVLENVLGSPPPAPPPNVPALEEQPAVKYQSMRERMEQHRKNPICSSCHARIDPIGFAMENFDGVGRWRTKQGETPLDTSGVLNGVKFDGAVQLRQLLMSHQDEFVVTVTRKLMTYALGRGVEYYDMPAIRKIVHDAKANDYRWSSLLVGITSSAPFRMRRSES